MKIEMRAFYRFCRDQCKIKTYVRRMRDGRKKPEITAGTVFLLLVLMIGWGKRHFLQMDQLARREAVRRLMGCRQRAMVCSDSTIERSLPGVDVEPVRALLGDI